MILPRHLPRLLNLLHNLPPLLRRRIHDPLLQTQHPPLTQLRHHLLRLIHAHLPQHLIHLIQAPALQRALQPRRERLKDSPRLDLERARVAIF